MDAHFSYPFLADTHARIGIEGWYSVMADLAVGEFPVERFLVVSRTPLSQNSGQEPGQLPDLHDPSAAGVALALPVDRKAYQGRVKQMRAEYGALARAAATITYFARVEATTTDARSKTQTLEPSLLVPLDGETFAISGQPSLNTSGTIRLPMTNPPRVKASPSYCCPVGFISCHHADSSGPGGCSALGEQLGGTASMPRPC